MSHFYLTLPSNSSEKFYPDNTLTQFTTKLQNDISLHGDWEVGLAEIAFPKNWYHIDKSQSILIECDDCQDITPALSYTDLVANPRRYSKRLDLTWGNYKSIKDLIIEINKHIQFEYSSPIPQWRRGNIDFSITERGLPSFSYDTYTNKVTVRVPGNTKITFTEDLRYMLGFIELNLGLNNSSRIPRNYQADRTGDIDCGRHALYVYCNLLEYVPVGDTSVPLLRIVDASGAPGGTITKWYEKPRYVPLQQKNFGSLEIDIRDSFGKKIPFESGTVIVTLHFRKTKGSYFLG